MGTFSLVTAPATEPITTSQLKDHLRITSSDEDTYLGLLITAARQAVEREQHRALIAQTWLYETDHFPCEFQLLPSPVTAITHIKYVDPDGTLQTLSSSAYQTQLNDVVGRVRLACNQTWPTVRSGIYNAVRVTFTASYTTVPESTKHAIKLLCGHLYWNREATAESALHEMPLAFQHLLNLEKVMVIA
jgi:uncharacterized phiE125 gp8 family phage protein